MCSPGVNSTLESSTKVFSERTCGDPDAYAAWCAGPEGQAAILRAAAALAERIESLGAPSVGHGTVSHAALLSSCALCL